MKILKSLLFVVICSFAFANNMTAQEFSPKEEFRSVWLTTAFGLDWPSGTNPESQKQQLRDIVANAKKDGLNAIVYQAVARADAHYISERLPAARRLTGTFGQVPTYDPLQFLIEETRKHGMEVHAWFNVFAVGNVSDTTTYEDGSIPHVFRTNRDWVYVRDDGVLWLNPGIPAAREWHVANLLEIVNKYDIDAVHFDFVRYPGPIPGDFQTKEEHYPGYQASLANWRRDMVTEFVSAAYDSIMQVKPWVKVGSTPVGHYKSNGGWSALSGYADVFQDSRRWLNEGINDYLAPQLYWDIGRPADGAKDGPDMAWLVNDWMNETYDRHIYVGIGAYKTNIYVQMPRQIDTTRHYGAHGQIYFRQGNISFNPYFLDRYNHRAIVPSMPWRSTTIPPSPLNQTASVNLSGSNSTITVRWNEPSYSDTNGDTFLRYAIYRIPADTDGDINELMSTSEYLIELTGLNEFNEVVPTGGAYVYYVRALTRNNVESEPGDAVFVDSAVSIDSGFEIASRIELEQNYPNPFNPVTAIRYTVIESTHTQIEVYDMLGRKVATLVNEIVAPGTYTLNFDASSLSSGVYVYMLRSGDLTQTRKMTLLK